MTDANNNPLLDKFPQLLDGVEWKKLGCFCEIKTGKGITKSDGSEDGKYPIISGGKEPMGYYHTFNRNARTVTVSRVGANAGFVSFIESDFYLNDKCFSVVPKDECDSKYLYYVLKNIECTIVDMQSEGGVPTINTQKVNSVTIPVPPLPIQEEIVRILDTFAELTAELTARKKQYEYYREFLIKNEELRVKKVRLGDVCEIKRGIRVVKKQLKDQGLYPVFQNSIAPMGYYDQYNREGNLPYVICAGSSSGSIGYCTSPFWAADDCFTIDGDKVLSRYVFHCLKQSNYKLFNQVRNGSMPRLPHTAIDDIQIPLPSLEEQERIVNILDKFDAYCNDISKGLPAEIEGRKKQYEYYRDQLLNFKRKER